MKTHFVNPTAVLYRQLQFAYEHFNEKLFASKLPECVFTLQRRGRTLSLFWRARWTDKRGREVHEIALNPAHLAERSIAEILQALVREQCTLWQHEFGEPSRAHYQNREWADRMISVGLMPSHTGKPGGRRTGQNVLHFAIKDGPFESACRSLIKQGFDMAWLDRDFRPDKWPAADLSAGLATRRSSPAYLHEAVRSHFKSLAGFSGKVPKSRNKVKYSCPVCRTNVWGRPDLSVRCQACDTGFIIDEVAEMLG